MKKILAIIDMQNDFLTGSLANYKAAEVVTGVIRLINTMSDTCIEEGSRLVVVTTKDTHFEDYLETNEGKKLPIKHCIMDTEGHQINSEIASLLKKLQDEDKIILKDMYKNSFGSLNWEDIFQIYDTMDIDMDITLCGVCTDICVVSNALILKALYPNEANISVAREATAGLNAELEEAAIKVMESCQINIV